LRASLGWLRWSPSGSTHCCAKRLRDRAVADEGVGVGVERFARLLEGRSLLWVQVESRGPPHVPRGGGVPGPGLGTAPRSTPSRSRATARRIAAATVMSVLLCLAAAGALLYSGLSGRTDVIDAVAPCWRVCRTCRR
jgi:hypothetical protein